MSRIPITRGGYEKLKTELDKLRNVDRNEVILAIQEARGHGDLSENAEYDAARNEQAEVEGRIKELEVMLENAVIVSKESNGCVSIGSTVTIEYDVDDTEEYTIVGSTEADPFENKISNVSPLAQAILGHRAGETVTVASPDGEYEVKIKEVK